MCEAGKNQTNSRLRQITIVYADNALAGSSVTSQNLSYSRAVTFQVLTSRNNLSSPLR